MRLIRPSVRLLHITKDAYELIEKIARISHKSKNTKNEPPETFIRRLMDKGHMGILEHANASMLLITDRGVSHELVRHRLASFLQESTRYVHYKELDVIEPPGLSGQSRKDWEICIRECERTYELLLEKGVSLDTARAVLPMCLKTEIVISANFREWLHIFTMRLSEHAHPQMRQIMKECFIVLNASYPVIFPSKLYG